MEVFTPRTSVFILAWVIAWSCRPAIDTWSGNRLVLIGVDGATWDVIDPLMAAGELPNFRKLVERGARSDLITLPPMVSPVVWTTYATGTFSRQHNVLDFTHPYVDGEKRPVESTIRTEPALWNIASEYERTVGVVGYYVTHPAEIVNGFVISDTILQLQAGTTYPKELAEEIDQIETSTERQQAYKRFLPWKYDPRASDDPTSPYQRVTQIVRGRIDGAIVRDEHVRRMSLQLLPRDVDLFITYFRIVDHASHSAWIYYDDVDFDEKPDPRDKELLGDLIPEAYRYIDDFLGEVIRWGGERTNIIVVSDHGSGSATGHYTIRDEALSDKLTGNHRFDAVLLAAGPDIRHGTVEGVNMMDVTPLVLSLLQLPVSQGLPGDIPEAMLSPQFLEQHPPQAVASYRWSRSVVDAAPMDPETDREAIEQLKALGYIDDAVETGRGGTESEHDFWEISEALRQRSLQGEILHYLMRRDLDKVSGLMALVLERDPNLSEDLPQLVIQGAKQMDECFDFPVFPEGAISDFWRTYRKSQN